MPTRSRREDTFISLFLTAYENYSWADASIDWLDKRMDKAVEALVTRTFDGKTLAIEHTIIEPFVGEKEDFAFFEAALLRIHTDESLPVPGRLIQVFVPVGTLQNQPKKVARDAIARSVHGWIRSNRLALRDGTSQHRCAITGIPGRPPFDIPLTLRVDPLQHHPDAERGILHVGRQQVGSNFGEVIEKALEKKLPKLVKTSADKRILLLERQQWILHPQDILDEIEKRRSSFPDLARVDEIWIVETIFYGTPFGGTYLRFELYENGNMVRSFDFDNGKLMNKSEDGVGEVIREWT
jgi:hypothetical protein